MAKTECSPGAMLTVALLPLPTAGQTRCSTSPDHPTVTATTLHPAFGLVSILIGAMAKVITWVGLKEGWWIKILCERNKIFCKSRGHPFGSKSAKSTYVPNLILHCQKFSLFMQFLNYFVILVYMKDSFHKRPLNL